MNDGVYVEYISTHSLTRRLTSGLLSRITSQQISTHSLTRRLTGFQFGLTIPKAYFNSQPHKEADQNAGVPLDDLNISTHSLTRRLTVVIEILGGKKSFQLTASQGG